MKNQFNRPGLIALKLAMSLCLLVLYSVPPVLATAEKAEKEDMNLEFTRQGDAVVAKLIPRAKSTSVLIRFSVSEGRLSEVQGFAFEEAARPEVDRKDFRSGLFKTIVQDLPPGAEVKVSITSDFFTSATEFWVFNESLDQPWMKSEAEHKEHPNLVQEIVLTVKDGGQYDADGKTNGMVILIGGTKDSFWGYSLGTLFIRFFGIFLVLSVLMIGMLFSGKIFQRAEQTPAAPPKSEPEESDVLKETEAAKHQGMDPALAAAIGIGLHLHLSSAQSQQYYYLLRPESGAWTQQGRERIMNVRYLALNRESGK